jgi:phage gp36-like protein
MSNFIELTDYPAVIHSEILTALTRGDNTIIEDAEDRAVEEMKGFLTSRYDVDQIFNATGTNRNKLILQYTLDIAIYRLHLIHNPQKMPESRVVLYEQALEWLKQVSKGNINPKDLPVLMPQNIHGQLLYGSNNKRNNHF